MSRYIAGVWSEATGEPMASHNPASEEPLWQGAAATADEVAAAVAAARHAFEGWALRPLEERIEIMRTFAAAVEAESDTFATLISEEVGKPLWDARTEVAAVVGKVAHSIRAYDERTGIVVGETAGVTSALRHRPHGVMAVFGPYNFPAHLPNGHIVPALLAGNTVVFKPSELTPAVGEHMVRVWESSGLPLGVLNLVQGGRDTGAALAADRIDGLLFTGSAQTGALLHQQFGGRPDIILALEMGGNNPLIVLDDADRDAAIQLIIHSAFLTTGQRCTCARRLLVPFGSYGDALVDSLAEATSQLTVGDPQAIEHPPFMGAMISGHAARRMFDAQNDLVSRGGVTLLEMGPIEGRTSAFVTPGIIEVTGLDVPDEEHFGPLLTVTRYDSLDDAIAIANDTRFGLAAGVIGGDRPTFEAIRNRLRAGIINWNRSTTGASSAAPFGGIGASGNHRPAAFYAADYSAYPVASLESEALVPPAPLPGQ